MPGARIEQGERITLRTIEREDSEFLQRARTDPAIRHPLGTVHHQNLSQVEDHFEEFIEADHNANFLVCLDGDAAGPGHPEDGDTAPIGVVNVMHTDWDRPNLAYWLVPDYHGEGYGKERSRSSSTRCFDPSTSTASAHTPSRTTPPRADFSNRLTSRRKGGRARNDSSRVHTATR